MENNNPLNNNPLRLSFSNLSNTKPANVSFSSSLQSRDSTKLKKSPRVKRSCVLRDKDNNSLNQTASYFAEYQNGAKNNAFNEHQKVTRNFKIDKEVMKKLSMKSLPSSPLTSPPLSPLQTHLSHFSLNDDNYREEDSGNETDELPDDDIITVIPETWNLSRSSDSLPSFSSKSSTPSSSSSPSPSTSPSSIISIIPHFPFKNFDKTQKNSHSACPSPILNKRNLNNVRRTQSDYSFTNPRKKSKFMEERPLAKSSPIALKFDNILTVDTSMDEDDSNIDNNIENNNINNNCINNNNDQNNNFTVNSNFEFPSQSIVHQNMQTIHCINNNNNNDDNNNLNETKCSTDYSENAQNNNENQFKYLYNNQEVNQENNNESFLVKPEFPITCLEMNKKETLKNVQYNEEGIIPTKISTGDFHCVDSEILTRLIDGEFNGRIKKYFLIDCRYDYEFENGHIKNAVHCPPHETFEFFETQIFTEENLKIAREIVIIFHCEFSSKRGPSAYRNLRKQDREINLENYPHLHFPHLFVLEGGYKAFFEAFPDYCNPSEYVEMRDKRYGEQLQINLRRSKEE